MATTFEIELPSGLTVSLRGWNIKWANDQVRSRMSPASMETTLLTECTTAVIDPGPYQIKDGTVNWNDVLICDRSVALLATRIPVWGRWLPIDHQCPRALPTPCRGKLQLPDEPIGGMGVATLDLEKIVTDEVIPLPDESRKKIQDGDNVFEIEWEGIPVRFRLMRGRDQDSVQRFVGEAPGEMVTRSLAARMISFGDVGVTRDPDGNVVYTSNARSEIAEVLKKGDFSYRLVELQDLMDDYDGGIETSIFLSCNDRNCGWSGEVDLPLGGMSSFWRPNSTKRKRKTRGQMKD
jgi:hypothetical protein